MNKNTIFIGVDVSKDYFDAYFPDKGHMRFRNDKEGFDLFGECIGNKYWCVMEATGSYHQQLSMFLYKNGVRLSVVNPLVIKRFIQMKLKRIKTDKSDAKMIAQYATEQPMELWHPAPEYIEECKMIHTVLQLFFKQSTALKNKLHSLNSKGKKRGSLVRSLKRQLKQTREEICSLEEELEQLIRANEPDLYTQITSIPGIGKKTAILLIVCTGGFRKFENHKQLISYLGLAPTERSSGSSVRGMRRISKNGQKITRNHLFMCSFTACEHNPACKALYERLVNKGKSKKLALIAVCNKLVKQAYGIAKSGIQYDPNYRSKLV